MHYKGRQREAKEFFQKSKSRTQALMLEAEEGRRLAEKLIEYQIEQDQTGDDFSQEIKEIISTLQDRAKHSPLALGGFALGIGFMCGAMRVQGDQLPPRTGWEGFNYEELPDLFDALLHGLHG